MTASETKTERKLIHAARYFDGKGIWHYLFLRRLSPVRYTWCEESPDGTESLTEIEAITPEEAMRLAAKHWKLRSFQNVNCGFRYTLPERDEHGINAFFHQMAASNSSMNGIYYDEELGNNCFVQNASDEAYRLWQRLKINNSLG